MAAAITELYVQDGSCRQTAPALIFIKSSRPKQVYYKIRRPSTASRRKNQVGEIPAANFLSHLILLYASISKM